MADLSSKTKNEIFDLIKRAAQEIYPDAEWTGLRTGSFEWLMSQIVAEVSVLNGQYLDLRANNAYLSTAVVRKDVRDIASNLGLVPSERAGAETTVSVVATDDVTVPLGSRLVTSNGEVFSTLAALVLSTATTLSGSVSVVHGEYDQVTYRARGDSGETIQLFKDDVLIDNLVVSVSGDVWTRVDNLFGQSATAEVYRVVFDELNRVSVKFGDGVFGKRLGADAEVIVDVYSGGGPAGNSVAANTITSFLDSFANSNNVSSVTNSDAASGGAAQDSLDAIAAQIPAQLRQIAGLINPEDIAQVLKANLSWLADANAERGHTKVNGIYIPTITVSAFPNNDTVGAMSGAQSTELSTFLTNRGELGVQWTAQDAYASPIEIELDVRLSNKNLESQKRAEIKAALVSDTGAPFNFANLSFNSEYKLQDVLQSVESVDGIVWARMKRFGRIPHALSVIGPSTAVDGFADIELGSTAEDGYFGFVADSSSSTVTSFYRPMRIDVVGSDHVKSTDINWLAQSHTIGSGSNLDDTNGPWLKVVSDKLSFKQLDRVWETSQWNGSDYTGNYLLKVQWVNASNVAQESYYHIDATTAPGTITTLEDADSPISGTAISATLADVGNTNITVKIIEDQETGTTLVTPNGDTIDVTHNDQNTLFLASDPSGVVPINQSSYIHFNEAPVDTTTNTWISDSGALRMRLYISTPFATGNELAIYTTQQISDRIEFNHPKEVFTLSETNITVNFI